MAGRRMWHTCLPPRRATRRLLRDSTENRGSVETGDAGGEAWAAAAAKGGTSTVRQQQFMEQNTPHNHNSENSTERRERERRASLLVFFLFLPTGAHARESLANGGFSKQNRKQHWQDVS